LTAEALLEQAVAEAAREYPDVTADSGAFAAHVREKAALVSPELADALGALRVSDLWLAFAAAHGDQAAIRRVDAACVTALQAAFRGRTFGGGGYEDAAQLLRLHLFLPGEEGRTKLHGYAGRGPLDAWLRVSATRLAIRFMRGDRTHETVSSDGAELGELVLRDAELSVLRSSVEPTVSEALRTAIDALEERDRALIRRHYLEGATLEELAAAEGIHRATAARWLAAIRARIARRVRQAVRGQLHISDRTCDSIVRLVSPELPEHVGRLLAQAPADAP
jgi:RNA polymerase sigma-70 factor, ECF subfamily